MKFVVWLYLQLIKYSVYLAPVVLLLIRLAWGWELAESGWGHLHNIEKMTERFTEWGVPFPSVNVYVSGVMELIGGVLWMLGLGTRLISIPMFFNFCVAYATASKAKLQALFPHFLANIDDVIDDAAFPFLVTSLILLAFGPGIFSIDAVLKRLFFSKYTVGATAGGDDGSKASTDFTDNPEQT